VKCGTDSVSAYHRNFHITLLNVTKRKKQTEQKASTEQNRTSIRDSMGLQEKKWITVSYATL